MQQIYAKIKKNSKDYLQNQFAKRDGEFPFPVKIKGLGEEYCVKGKLGERGDISHKDGARMMTRARDVTE